MRSSKKERLTSRNSPDEDKPGSAGQRPRRWRIESLDPRGATQDFVGQFRTRSDRHGDGIP